jgi:hypothetical protein
LADASAFIVPNRGPNRGAAFGNDSALFRDCGAKKRKNPASGLRTRSLKLRGARDIYIKNASGIGAEDLVIKSKIPKNLEDWSNDGRWLVYNEAVPNNSDDLVALLLDSRKPVDILRTRFLEDKGRFSPDGKWLAYQSDESGRSEVYIQPFPPTGEKWQISNDRGGQSQWRGDGKELYYSTITTPVRMMAVDITAADRPFEPAFHTCSSKQTCRISARATAG